MQNYYNLSNREEYESYADYLKTVNFDKILVFLSEKYKGKKVLIYGTGILFDVISSNYSLKDYFNICAVSDLKYEKEDIPEYKGFKTIKPSQISSAGADVILVSTVNPGKIKQFIVDNNYAAKTTTISPIIQFSFSARLHNFKVKFKTALEYLAVTKNIFNFTKYLFFLNENEYRAKVNYAKVIKAIRKDKYRKIRVAFLCEENAKWGYQSVYEELKKDENFEVLPIINLPVITTRRQEFLQEKNMQFFSGMGMDSVDGYNYQTGSYNPLESYKPDIVFYQQPWYVVRSQCPQMVSKYALTCIVSYGFTSIDAKSWGSDAVRKFSGNLWKMFAESEYHNKFYQKAAGLKHKDIMITKGYPKLDYYNSPVDESYEALWKDEGKSEKHRIIWAPHHSIDGGELRMSLFKEQSTEFLELAKRHPEYSFVVKPHPLLKNKCVSEHFFTAEEYDSYMNEWNSLPNGCVYDSGNYFDIFKTSDILLTDCSSFLAEYFYSGKPIIFYESTNRAGFNSFGKKIKRFSGIYKRYG